MKAKPVITFAPSETKKCMNLEFDCPAMEFFIREVAKANDAL